MSAPFKTGDRVILFHGWNDTPKCAVLNYNEVSKKLSLVESQPKGRVFHNVAPENVRALGPFERLMDVFTTYPGVNDIKTGTKRDRESEMDWKIRNSRYPVVAWDEDNVSLADLYFSDPKSSTSVQSAGAVKRSRSNDQD